jgi:predicted acyl esterase
MPNKLKDVQTTDKTHHPYILEENVSILLKGTGLPIRVNVYRPKSEDLVPVLVTFGPYGKDVPYAVYVTFWNIQNVRELLDQSS